MSTMSRRNNVDAIIQTALAVFSIIILAILGVFLFKLSPNTNINHKKWQSLSMRRKLPI